MIFQFKEANIMAMNKEELLEMVEATINENGTRGITGKALNLALTEIINAMGTGGGADTVYLIPAVQEESITTDELFSDESINAKIAHNVEVYNKITEKFKTTGEASMLVVDNTLLMSDDYSTVTGHVVTPTDVMYMTLEEQMPSKLSFNPYYYYEIGQVAVMVYAYPYFWSEIQFMLLPDGTCVVASNSPK